MTHSDSLKPIQIWEDSFGYLQINNPEINAHIDYVLNQNYTILKKILGIKIPIDMKQYQGWFKDYIWLNRYKKSCISCQNSLYAYIYMHYLYNLKLNKELLKNYDRMLNMIL